jgi:hypothetical protein
MEGAYYMSYTLTVAGRTAQHLNRFLAHTFYDNHKLMA